MSGCWNSSPTLRQKSASWRILSDSRRYWSRSSFVYLPPSPSFSSSRSSASCRGGWSGSSTCSRLLERSWFCSSRVVSEPSSTSLSPMSVTKPATSTRRNEVTSILLCSGVSTGTSTKLEQPAERSGRRRALRIRLPRLAIAFVIGFTEQVVVLLDVHVAGLELERLLVGLAGLVEGALLLERHGEIVQGVGVFGFDRDGLLEA